MPKCNILKNVRKTKKKGEKNRKYIWNTISHVKFMIRCDLCTVWCHGECVDVKEGDYKRGEKYRGNKCKDQTKSCNDGEMDTQRKDIGKDREKSKPTTKTMMSAC